jgi:hypothetical protein
MPDITITIDSTDARCAKCACTAPLFIRSFIRQPDESYHADGDLPAGWDNSIILGTRRVLCPACIGTFEGPEGQ